MTTTSAVLSSACVSLLLLWPGVARRTRARDRLRTRPGEAPLRVEAPAAGGSGDLAFALDLVAAALAAGVPVAEALEAASEGAAAWGAQLRAMAVSIRCGADLRGAVATDPAFRRAVRALERSQQHGSSASSALGRVSAELRADSAARAAERARRAGVHVVAPLILCFLPAFVLVGVVPVVLGLAAGAALLG